MRGDRDRASRLFRLAGHVLRRQHERRGPDLSANLRRYVCEGGLREAVYDETPLAAADLLNDQVLPFYESQGVQLLRVLTDRGTEYCGMVEQHEFSCIWPSTTSTKHAPKPSHHKPMGSASASIRRS